MEVFDAVQNPLVKLAAAPETLLLPKGKLPATVLSALVKLFGQAKKVEPSSFTAPQGLDTLLTDGFDQEQIWEQLQLLNEPWTEYLSAEQHKLTRQDASGAAVVTIWGKPKTTPSMGGDDADDNDDASEASEGEGKGEGDENGIMAFDPSMLDGDFSDEGEADDDDDDEMEEEIEEDDEAPTPKKTKGKGKSKLSKASKPTGKGSELDDDFFKLHEMEAFLNAEDERYMRGDGPKVDFFKEGDDEDEEDEDGEDGEDGEGGEEKDASELKYADFYGGDDEGSGSEEEDEFGDVSGDEMEALDEGLEDAQDAEGRDEASLGLDDSEDEDSGRTKKSRFELQQERIKQQIEELEEFNVGDKPWQLAGEVQAPKRPEDSLLQEDLDFEVTSRPAPEITEESTKTLEQVVIQRIKDQAFDDVQRKEDPKNLPAYKPPAVGELDQQKSKKGLGDVYGDDYARKSDPTKSTAAEEALGKDHEEINELFKALHAQLNALTNFHYTPDAVESEIKTVTNVAAISMEDATPLGSNTATALAPEELLEKAKGGHVQSNEEKSATDRKRERRLKKKKKKLARLEEEIKERVVDPAGQSKKAAIKKLEKDKNVTFIGKDGDATKQSSTKFFKRLAEDPLGQSGKAKRAKKALESSKTASQLRL